MCAGHRTPALPVRVEVQSKQMDLVRESALSAMKQIAALRMEMAAKVTESARAHSYYSISTGTQIGAPPAVPFLTPASKSVLYTLCSVRKGLIQPT